MQNSWSTTGRPATTTISMRTNTILVPAMSFTLVVFGHATTKITAVPFSIVKPGKYVLATNLTLSGNNVNAITVNQSNVVIELNGFTLSTTGSSNTGVSVATTVNNVTVQDGTVSGFDFGITLQGSQQSVQNVRLFTGTYGVLASSCTFSSIQNCLILGVNSSSGIGVDLGTCSNVVVQNNQIANVGNGCFSSGSTGGNSFIANYISNCINGLNLESGDKYEGNVATGCTTDFAGGLPVGQENG
jgi:Right handed beta helix region